MDRNRKFTFNILMIVRDNPAYRNRMREAQKHIAVLIAEYVILDGLVPDHLVYAYNFFKERV